MGKPLLAPRFASVVREDSSSGESVSETRVDFGRFDGSKIARTPQGGLKVPAYLTREGVFEYRNPNGSVRREYRPAAEVFKADSLATLDDAPVTDLHPGMVDTTNHKEVSKGHVRDVKQDDRMVAAYVLVQDSELIKAVESGARKEISCGYTCNFDATPGVTPDGLPYDGIQKDIRYNHVALLPPGAGRAGSQVSLRLDSTTAVQLPNQEVRIVTKITFDGKEYVEGSKEHLDAMTAKIAVETKRADALEGERDQLKKDLAEAPAKVAASMQARAALETSARKVLGADVKFDGKSDLDVMSMAIAHVDPSVKLDGKSAEYVSGRFDSVLTTSETTGSVGTARVAALQAITVLPKSVETPKPVVPRWAEPLNPTKK